MEVIESNLELGRIVMNRIQQVVGRAIDGDLERVIEPLASYISAANQPKVALASALAFLVSEVERTDRMARVQVSNFKERHGR